jgi:hypothetical protein
MGGVLNIYGRITKDGVLTVSNTTRLKDFCSHWYDKRFVMEIIIMDPGSVDNYVWYIMKVIVPAIIRGHKDYGTLITQQEAIDYIRETCPLFSNPNGGEKLKLFNYKKYKPDCELIPEDLQIVIEWLHYHVLEYFGIVIGEPKGEQFFNKT